MKTGAITAVFALGSLCMGTADRSFADGAATLARGLAALEAGRIDAALKDLDAAMKQGQPDAGFYLGRMLETGTGVQADMAKALQLHQHAARQGSPKSLNRLGMLAMSGQGVKQDDAAARRLVCDAADKGDADGAYNCATLLTAGRGGAADRNAALTRYEQAAAAGHKAAHLALAFIYKAGSDMGTSPAIKPDLRRAQGHFEQAAARGNPIGLFELAQMYEAGLPLARDLTKAHLYYTLAAARQHEPARAAATRIAARLSTGQAEASRFAAASWRAIDD